MGKTAAHPEDVHICMYIYLCIHESTPYWYMFTSVSYIYYGVAMITRLLKIIGVFRGISSLL